MWDGFAPPKPEGNKLFPATGKQKVGSALGRIGVCVVRG
jgi:hypothetical protein